MNIPFVFPGTSTVTSGKSALPKHSASFDDTFRQTQTESFTGASQAAPTWEQTKSGQDAATAPAERQSSSSLKPKERKESVREKKVEKKNGERDTKKVSSEEKKTQAAAETERPRPPREQEGEENKEASPDTAHDPSQHATASQDDRGGKKEPDQTGAAETAHNPAATPGTITEAEGSLAQSFALNDSGTGLLQDAGIAEETGTAEITLTTQSAADAVLAPSSEQTATTATLMAAATPQTSDIFPGSPENPNGAAAPHVSLLKAQVGGNKMLAAAKEWKEQNDAMVKAFQQIKDGGSGDNILSQAVSALSEQNGVSQENSGQLLGQSPGSQPSPSTSASGSAGTSFVLPAMTPAATSFDSAAVAQTGRATVFQSPTENQIASQVIEHLNVNSLKETSSMRIRLHPEELGQVKLELQITRDVVTAHLHTENRQVQDALLGQMERLRHTLAEQGLTLGDIFVSVDAGQNNDSMSKDRSFRAQSRSNQGLETEAADLEEPSLLTPGTGYTLGGLSLMV